jgi:hypothetical protein
MSVDQARKSREDQENARIVAALREAGIEVTSVFDLVKRPQARAIPVLLPYLHEDLDPWIKQGVVRALSIKPASSLALRPMLNEFKQPNISDGLRWAIGNAISILATKEVLGELLELVSENGTEERDR